MAAQEIQFEKCAVGCRVRYEGADFRAETIFYDKGLGRQKYSYFHRLVWNTPALRIWVPDMWNHANNLRQRA